MVLQNCMPYSFCQNSFSVSDAFSSVHYNLYAAIRLNPFSLKLLYRYHVREIVHEWIELWSSDISGTSKVIKWAEMSDVCRNELFVRASLTNGTESGCSYKLKVLKKEDFTVQVKDISKVWNFDHSKFSVDWLDWETEYFLLLRGKRLRDLDLARQQKLDS